MGIVIGPLEAGCDRKSFTCGQTDLDDWFHRRAGQDQRRNIAKVFVAVDETLGVVGFYSLSSFTLDLKEIPPEIACKLPRYNLVPAAMIGRLARDERVRGKGIGELLLADAVRRVLVASRVLAVFTIVVEAKDERASKFYEGFGFCPLPLHPNRLFLLTSSAMAAVERA